MTSAIEDDGVRLSCSSKAKVGLWADGSGVIARVAADDRNGPLREIAHIVGGGEDEGT